MKEVTKAIKLLQKGDLISTGDGPAEVLEDEEFDQWDRTVKVIYLVGTGSRSRGRTEQLDLYYEPRLMTQAEVNEDLKNI